MTRSRAYRGFIDHEATGLIGALCYGFGYWQASGQVLHAVRASLVFLAIFTVYAVAVYLIRRIAGGKR